MMYKQNSRYEVLTPSGFQDFDGIKKTTRNDNIVITFCDSSNITVTPEHRFYVGSNNKGKIFRKANKLKNKHKISTKKISKIKHNVILENNSFYDLVNVQNGNIYNTSDVVSHNCAWIDEAKIKAFMDSVKPSLSSGTNNKFVIISTPNGYNFFHTAWQNAKNKISDFKTYFANWKAVNGRDEKWKAKTIKDDDLTPMEFQQNHECSFIGSSATLLSVETLSNFSKSNVLIDDFIVPGAKLYKEYNENSLYLMTIDSSKTVGKNDAENDYICLNVLELSDTNIEQVLTFRTNDIHYTEMSEIAYNIGESFNFPWVVVENNEGAGQSIVDTLHSEYEYPNIYADPKHEGLILGIRTTTNRRQIGLSTLKKLIDKLILIINDSDTIDEFFTFIKIGKKYQASAGQTDDCIMSLVLLIYFLLDDKNDLEITISDYLKGEVNIEKDSEDDINFFIGANQEDFSLDKYMLLQGKDF